MKPVIELKSLEASAYITQITFARHGEPIYAGDPECQEKVGEGLKEPPGITLLLTDLSGMSVEDINAALAALFTDRSSKFRVRIEIEKGC